MDAFQGYRVAAAVLVLSAMGVAQAEQAEKKTVEALYPNLASGSLAYAQPKALPDGVLLKAEGVEIKLAEIENAIAQQSPQVQTMIEKEKFYVLEQEAAGKLLTIIARKTLDVQTQNLEQMSETQLVHTLFDQLTKDVTADQDEQKTFYDENPNLFHDAPFDGIQPQIAHYLTQLKKQDLVDDYIKKLGQRMTIEVADTWTKEQSVAAEDNPLDKARQGGKPTLAMFYAESPCCPDTTGSILAEVAKHFGDTLNVVTLNPNTAPILAARYNVRDNPTLLFYDAKGKEAFREQKAMSREAITAKLAEIGVK